MMVDRTARDRLALAIEEFLADKISAFKFDDRIYAVADETDDETVREVTHLLWYHYDDVIDHKAALSQTEWDYFQRLLLLLRSDASLKNERPDESPKGEQLRRWTRRQTIALAAIAAFVVGLILLGFGWQLLLVTVPLGVISMKLSSWPPGEDEADTDKYIRLTPYSSVSELLAVHRTVSAFRKRRYPERMKSRHIGSPFANGCMKLLAGALWLVFSPIVLLFQAFPQSTTRIVPA